MNNPLVSVIITTFNRVDLIDRAIKGVANQTYPNFEIIVVDDASEDDTENHIKKVWGNKIKYARHEKNKGVQFASNTGFDLSSGKYLAFIGDDDEWTDPDKLRKQVEIFEKDPENRYGIVTTGVQVIRPNESFDKIITRPKNLLKHLIGGNGIIWGSAALLRRDVFVKAGKFAEELPKGTDSDVYRRIVMLGYDVYFIKEAAVKIYEDHPRMTPLDNTNSIIKAIRSQNYNLKNYSYYNDLYPSVKSYRLYMLGNLHEKLFNLNRDKNNLGIAKNFYLLSIKTYILNYKSWYKLILFPLKHFKS